ncbi:DNA polymerase/3'-5' exonuclease PolX [Flavihumibacter profundi]|uniref:DNA polymerase/3'-5' exonuclease PolX n=1 Tax=Flavihumibacter profundi TaxID=2716883 RepID=UPI001CC75603|nr:DNA polymerase/3'-5' exonuclease PolX [Flavihumibacter profundi]MBZ5856896.1 DNA polymerase/3'-5' exonuclease PolX [Flavihumibacter profundi]
MILKVPVLRDFFFYIHPTFTRMMDNYAIADQFALLARLMDIHGDNPFKAKSYAAAAFAIEKLPVQLSETPPEKIASFKGIGDSAAKKIIELLNTGQLAALNELIFKTPPGILEMMQIKGLGPKKIATIWKEMGLESLGELLYACDENRLLMYKGFGEKTQESVKQSIHFFFQNKGNFLFAEIEPYALKVEKILRDKFPDYPSSLAGEISRQSNIITHVQVMTAIPKEILTPFLQAQHFELFNTDHTISATGAEGIKLNFILSTKETFVSRHFASTCSESFLQAFTDATGFTTDQQFAGEAELFSHFNMSTVPVNQRELPIFIQKAKENKLSPAIQVEDIKGIIHSHSNWSDGLHTLEVMAKACIEKGYEYLVISDHSRSAFYANGLSVDRIREQHTLIDELNTKLAPFRIFKSIECDILNDGSLDYEDAVLNSFDLVITSIHSNLKMTEEKAMQRLLKAIQHPSTTILGHMTGRLLLSRPGYPVDHKMLIDACTDHQVVIEINAHPRRLDIDWSWIPYAMEKGCLLSVNPDAHQVEGFEDVRYGVISAQKGGLTASHNLSSFSRTELESFLQKQSAKRG